jgi:photosystem II stability/assembly factor-like uncharacterized protein
MAAYMMPGEGQMDARGPHTRRTDPRLTHGRLTQVRLTHGRLTQVRLTHGRLTSAGRGRAGPIYLALLLAAAASGCGTGLAAGSRQEPMRSAGPDFTAKSRPSTSSPAARPPAQGPIWLQSLQMVSPAVGWALRWTQNPGSADDATLGPARTTDGGRAWSDVTPAAARPLLTPTETEAILVAADASRAWLAVTQSGRRPVTVIFGTTSGGRSWTRSAPIRSRGSANGLAFPLAHGGPHADSGTGQTGGLAGGLSGKSVPSYSAGWLLQNLGNAMGSLNGIRVYRSTDGGRAWSPIAQTPPGPQSGTSSSGLPGYCAKIGITFATPTTGWLNGTCDSLSDALLVTHDGGLHWAPQPLPLPLTTCQASSCEIAAPQFFGHTGFLTIGRSAGSAYFLVSHDTDSAWSTVPLPADAGAQPRIQFFDARRGLLIPAGQGAIGRVFYLTADAGATWTPVRQGRTFRQLSIMFDFVSLRVGFGWSPGTDATSGAPVIYRTKDSGRIWTPVSR